MEPIEPTTTIQASGIDTVMHDNEHPYVLNGDTPNGFVNPNDLHPQDTLSTPLPALAPDQLSENLDNIYDTSPQIRRQTPLLPTGVCYDVRMKYHLNSDYSDNAAHPEDPRRIEEIFNALTKAGLIYSGSDHNLQKILKETPTKYMYRILAREAERAEICLVHTPGHFEWARELAHKLPKELREITATFDMGRKSLYVSPLTYISALISAGGAIESCKRVVEGQLKNAIAVIRPPGHHAEANDAMGFCIFNNVPIAARVCMRDYPEKCRKVLILDWDVHHGNGVQNIFYDDPNVLYISIHVYEGGSFYPGAPENPDVPDGGIPNLGSGAGIGKNVNIGWHAQGMGDGEYMAAFQRIVMPIAQEFDPDLVIVSAGFDAAAGDELGGCFVTPACYSHMTHMLMSLADGKMAVCLEGGYNLAAISRSALAVTQTLMGQPPQRIEIPPINNKASRDLELVKAYHSKYWRCMRTGVVQVSELQQRNAERLSNVIRSHEKTIVAQKHNMVTMPILRNKTNRVFENQVLVTPRIHQAKRVLLMMHDPPEIYAQPDYATNAVASYNAWVTGDYLAYIDWAIDHGFGVIDVNFPKEIPQDDSIPWHQKPTDEDIQQQSKDLLSYLWDNHLQINPAAPIALLGIGDACLGIKQLLISRDVKDRIPCVLSFVTGSLRPVKSETDLQLSPWYKNNSLIYVSADHSCWNDEENKKRIRKNRFGSVSKSEVGGLGPMLRKYVGPGTSWLEEKVLDWESKRLDVEESEESDGYVEPSTRMPVTGGDNGGRGSAVAAV